MNFLIIVKQSLSKDMILPPGRCLEMSGDFFDCHSLGGVLLLASKKAVSVLQSLIMPNVHNITQNMMLSACNKE